MLLMSLVTVPNLNAITKHLIFYRYNRKIAEFYNLMNDPLLTTSQPEHIEMYKGNKRHMTRILFAMMSLISLIPVVSVLRTFFELILGNGVTKPQTAISHHEGAMIIYISIILFAIGFIQGLGHIAMDLVIAAHYSIVRTQLKVLGNKLEHIFHDLNDGRTLPMERLVDCLKQQQMIIKLCHGIDSVFGVATLSQFVYMAISLCVVLTIVVSTPGIQIVVYMLSFLLQLFLYCYYGNGVTSESEKLSTWLYESDWLLTPVPMRRDLVISMMALSRKITFKSAMIIPLNCATYISILRFAYSLFTLIKESK